AIGIAQKRTVAGVHLHRKSIARDRGPSGRHVDGHDFIGPPRPAFVAPWEMTLNVSSRILGAVVLPSRVLRDGGSHREGPPWGASHPLAVMVGALAGNMAPLIRRIKRRG